MHEIDPFALMCLDFIVSDYQEFIEMMIDFKRAFYWEADVEEEEEVN